jgi:hypothetical protein
MRTSMMAVTCSVLIGLAGCSGSDSGGGSTPEAGATGGGEVMSALEVVQAESAGRHGALRGRQPGRHRGPPAVGVGQQMLAECFETIGG